MMLAVVVILTAMPQLDHLEVLQEIRVEGSVWLNFMMWFANCYLFATHSRAAVGCQFSFVTNCLKKADILHIQSISFTCGGFSIEVCDVIAY